MDQSTIAWMRPVSMATVRVQANCRACRSDVDEFKGPGSMMSMITVPLTLFIVAQTMQLQIIEVLR